MFEEKVTTKDSHVKTVVAGSAEELAEGVAAVKGDQQAVSPDLHNPKEPNAVVSPDNLHTEPPYVQPSEPGAPVELPPEEVSVQKPETKKVQAKAKK